MSRIEQGPGTAPKEVKKTPLPHDIYQQMQTRLADRKLTAAADALGRLASRQRVTDTRGRVTFTQATGEEISRDAKMLAEEIISGSNESRHLTGWTKNTFDGIERRVKHIYVMLGAKEPQRDDTEQQTETAFTDYVLVERTTQLTEGHYFTKLALEKKQPKKITTAAS